jgi:hypothetical protein
MHRETTKTGEGTAVARANSGSSLGGGPELSAQQPPSDANRGSKPHLGGSSVAINQGRSPFARLTYTKIVVVLGFAAGFLLSRHLWISSRYYPLISVWHGLPRIPYPLDYICFASLFLLLGVIASASRPKPYIFCFATLLLFVAIFDQTRWQPWVYLYLFILLALGCFSWNADDTRSQENTLNICRLIVGTTYLYSGLQKLNPRFATGLASLFGPIASHWTATHALGWIVAIIEVAIALGLFTRRYRDIAVVFGTLMHLFILFTCGFIYNWNSVVWPWNGAMIALLWLLFWKTSFSWQAVVWRNPIRFQKLVLVLFGIMPLLSFFGWWDSYLSASLYSANIPEGILFVGKDVAGTLPAPIQKYVTTQPGVADMLKIQDWSLGELNVPPYPATRAFRTIGADICKYSHNSPDVALLVREKDTLLGKGRVLHDSCLGTLLVDKW